MKLKLVVLLILWCAGIVPVFADNPPSGGQQQGFGLQATIFSRVQQTNESLVNNYSVIANYPPTPGDIYTLTINSETTPEIGNATQQVISYPIQLSEDMKLDVPFIGIVDARGKTLPQLKDLITTEIRERLPVQYVNFLLTTPAEFNVFVYGGVESPGYITATPLTTVIDAIGLAKGFKEGASYRTIQLVRNGRPQVLDISRFYIDADFASNPRLQPGDMLYVPEAQVVATIEGQVLYPGVYELLPTETLQTLIDLAGGFAPGALTNRIEVARVDPRGAHSVITVSADQAASFQPKIGDTVTVPSTSVNAEMVSIEGAIFGKPRSGTGPVVVPSDPVRLDFPYYPGISVLDVLDDVGGPTPYALPNEEYVVERASGKSVPVSIDTLWKTRDLSLDRVLEPGDHIVVPMETLKVFVTGQVPTPGALPYSNETTVATYLLLSGGILQNTGDPKGIFSVKFDGTRTKLNVNQTVAPGTIIYVAKKPLFETDQAVQNFLIITGWGTAVIAVLTTLVNFIFLIQPSVANVLNHLGL